MEGPYGSEWPAEEKLKRREMVSSEACYILVYQAPNSNTKEMSTGSCTNEGHILGFVHYRFTLEEEIPVVYVYELQLQSCVQGKGLGKFLMQLIELIARKSQMGAVVLTVQKANLLAMNFYINKLRYAISSISPSNVDPLTGLEKNYEILCKVFNAEAKSALENLQIGTMKHLRREQFIRVVKSPVHSFAPTDSENSHQTRLCSDKNSDPVIRFTAAFLFDSTTRSDSVQLKVYFSATPNFASQSLDPSRLIRSLMLGFSSSFGASRIKLLSFSVFKGFGAEAFF